MLILLKILHILVCLFMIAVVLLQSGKGAEMGASFGSSGSQSVFGAGGGTTFLSKLTTGVAVVFMLTSMLLAYLAGTPSSSSIMVDKAKAVSAVKQPAQSTQTPAQVPVQGKPVTAPAVPQTQPKK